MAFALVFDDDCDIRNDREESRGILQHVLGMESIFTILVHWGDRMFWEGSSVLYRREFKKRGASANRTNSTTTSLVLAMPSALHFIVSSGFCRACNSQTRYLCLILTPILLLYCRCLTPEPVGSPAKSQLPGRLYTYSSHHGTKHPDCSCLF